MFISPAHCSWYHYPQLTRHCHYLPRHTLPVRWRYHGWLIQHLCCLPVIRTRATARLLIVGWLRHWLPHERDSHEWRQSWLIIVYYWLWLLLRDDGIVGTVIDTPLIIGDCPVIRRW